MIKFWENTNFRWVRKRMGGTWYQVSVSYSGKYWVNRKPAHHEEIHGREYY